MPGLGKGFQCKSITGSDNIHSSISVSKDYVYILSNVVFKSKIDRKLLTNIDLYDLKNNYKYYGTIQVVDNENSDSYILSISSINDHLFLLNSKGELFKLKIS